MREVKKGKRLRSRDLDGGLEDWKPIWPADVFCLAITEHFYFYFFVESEFTANF